MFSIAAALGLQRPRVADIGGGVELDGDDAPPPLVGGLLFLVTSQHLQNERNAGDEDGPHRGEFGPARGSVHADEGERRELVRMR